MKAGISAEELLDGFGLDEKLSHKEYVNLLHTLELWGYRGEVEPVPDEVTGDTLLGFLTIFLGRMCYDARDHTGTIYPHRLAEQLVRGLESRGLVSS